jgi:hypothetical protein
MIEIDLEKENPILLKDIKDCCAVSYQTLSTEDKKIY